MKGNNVTFSMQLSLFDENATQLRKYMAELTGCSITQVMALAWKTEKSGRSALANQVQRSIPAPSSYGSGSGSGSGNGGRGQRTLRCEAVRSSAYTVHSASDCDRTVCTLRPYRGNRWLCNDSAGQHVPSG